MSKDNLKNLNEAYRKVYIKEHSSSDIAEDVIQFIFHKSDPSVIEEYLNHKYTLGNNNENIKHIWESIKDRFDNTAQIGAFVRALKNSDETF
jgi:hypothetical protein